MTERPRALVTGFSRGIGRAIALRLAQDGYDIAGCSRHAGDEAEHSRAAIGRHGATCHAAACDVSDLTAVEEFVREAEDAIGPITHVVNNAGILRDHPIVLMSQDDWREVIDADLTGVWNMCRAMALRFVKRRAGVIVNISSAVGVLGGEGQCNYSAAKAGVIGLSLSLAKELGPRGIRVNAVAPGLVETTMISDMPGKARDRVLERTSLRRIGTPDDIAGAVAFLLSDDAAYVTGHVLRVDGGLA
ncbi:3-oxoacyl-[acyl-carrier protein] reductase [Nonomuraea solani]|uniref:3-oxoacyl-[acyl-carrier protein] reductase n=2 Tax=Nonomuraea solani TaxID=1144553 RepID=A0A1H5Y7H8_9ACTN|nr:3-oxoacyl-[acyl-carrier protein] reductase [Nonomuraea solani]